MTNHLDRIIGVMKLNKEVYKEIQKDPEALKQAFIILIFVGLCSAIGNHLYNSAINLGLLYIIISPILAILGGAILSFLIHISAKILGGKADYSEFFKVYAFSGFPSLLSVIPLGNIVGGVWSLICCMFAVKNVYGLDWLRAIISVLVPGFILSSIVISIIVIWLASTGYLAPL